VQQSRQKGARSCEFPGVLAARREEGKGGRLGRSEASGFRVDGLKRTQFRPPQAKPRVRTSRVRQSGEGVGADTPMGATHRSTSGVAKRVGFGQPNVHHALREQNVKWPPVRRLSVA
jgi:hypothetical protein